MDSKEDLSTELIGILKKKKSIFILKVIITSIILFKICSNFLYTNDEMISYMLSILVSYFLIKD